MKTENQTQVEESISSKIAVIIDNKIKVFEPYKIAVQELIDNAKKIEKPVDFSDKKAFDFINDERIKLKNKRCEIQRDKKAITDVISAALKESKGKVDASADSLITDIESEENRLDSYVCEYKQYKEIEKQKAAKLEAERIEGLKKQLFDLGFVLNPFEKVWQYKEMSMTDFDLQILSKEDFETFYNNARCYIANEEKKEQEEFEKKELYEKRVKEISPYSQFFNENEETKRRVENVGIIGQDIYDELLYELKKYKDFLDKKKAKEEQELKAAQKKLSDEQAEFEKQKAEQKAETERLEKEKQKLITDKNNAIAQRLLNSGVDTSFFDFETLHLQSESWIIEQINVATEIKLQKELQAKIDYENKVIADNKINIAAGEMAAKTGLTALFCKNVIEQGNYANLDTFVNSYIQTHLQKIEAEKQEQEAAKSDKLKLTEYIEKVKAIPFPEMKGKSGQKKLDLIKSQIENL